MSDLPVQIGETVDGKYLVEEVLGEGGMGVIYAAKHVQLEQRVALKFLLASFASESEHLERFNREARIAVKIVSDHAVRVLDVGALANGVPYIVMELLEGEDLATVLCKTGPLPVSDAVKHVLHACEALAELHAFGMVHRDLKPSNLFLARRPDGTVRIKLIDFGISKLGDRHPSDDGESAQSLTRTRSIVGSPNYMSPEQLRTPRDVDGRSDIWSIAVTLYEALAGELPFAAETLADLYASVLKDDPKPLARTDVPAGLADVFLHAFAKKPSDRFADVGELAAALLPFAPGCEESVERITGVLNRARAEHRSPRASVRRLETESNPDILEAQTANTVPPGKLRRADSGPMRVSRGGSVTGPDGPTSVRAITLANAEAPSIHPALGDLSRVPRLAIPRSDLHTLPLEPRIAFLLSRVDGALTFEELLDISGMPQDDAIKIFVDMLQQNVIEITEASQAAHR